MVKKRRFLRWYIVLGLLGFSVILPVKGVSGGDGDSPSAGAGDSLRASGKDTASKPSQASHPRQASGDAAPPPGSGDASGSGEKDLSEWVSQISKKGKKPVEIKRDVSSLNEAVQDSQKQREGIQKEMQAYWDEEAQRSEEGDLAPDDQKRLPASARDFDEYQIRWEKPPDE